MKDKYIAAKARWAAKQAGRTKSVVRSTDRLPPGQREVKNFPVLDMGIQPEVAQADWRLKIHGLVENPVTLDWEQFMALEQFADISDFHCVTTWSQYDMEWRGVSFFTLTKRSATFLRSMLIFSLRCSLEPPQPVTYSGETPPDK